MAIQFGRETKDLQGQTPCLSPGHSIGPISLESQAVSRALAIHAASSVQEDPHGAAATVGRGPGRLMDIESHDSVGGGSGVDSI